MWKKKEQRKIFEIRVKILEKGKLMGGRKKKHAWEKGRNYLKDIKSNRKAEVEVKCDWKKGEIKIEKNKINLEKKFWKSKKKKEKW